jgi:hypothetical protein
MTDQNRKLNLISQQRDAGVANTPSPRAILNCGSTKARSN